MGIRIIDHSCKKLIEKNESINQELESNDFYIENDGIDGRVLIDEIQFCPYCGFKLKK